MKTYIPSITGGVVALTITEDREEQFKKATIRAQQGAPKTEPFVSSGNEGTRSCGMCHERYDITLNACPNCGAPNMEKFGEGFDGFDFLGEVSLAAFLWRRFSGGAYSAIAMFLCPARNVLFWIM